MNKFQLFNNKVASVILIVELVLSASISWYTCNIIDIGSISNNISNKLMIETNEIDSLKYLTEWFVMCFGGVIGITVIYYYIIDICIMLNVTIFRSIQRRLE